MSALSAATAPATATEGSPEGLSPFPSSFSRRCCSCCRRGCMQVGVIYVPFYLLGFRVVSTTAAATRRVEPIVCRRRWQACCGGDRQRRSHAACYCTQRGPHRNGCRRRDYSCCVGDIKIFRCSSCASVVRIACRLCCRRCCCRNAAAAAAAATSTLAAGYTVGR